jgi:hypothetical protein
MFDSLFSVTRYDSLGVRDFVVGVVDDGFNLFCCVMDAERPKLVVNSV